MLPCFPLALLSLTTDVGQVDGQTKTFLAASVDLLTTGIPENNVELEFACRCRLRRRRGRRRSLAGGPRHDSGPTTVSLESVPADLRTNVEAVSVNAEGENREQNEEEDEDEGEEAQPEAAAKVRLRGADDQVLGEVWAELPGAPLDWARYPLYAPGAAAGASKGASGAKVLDDRGAGLDRGQVIPARPETLRRRWGWGGGTISKICDSGEANSTVMSYRPWFRPRRPRNVVGDVKLRIAWVPSGLAVTVHGWREIRSTVEEPGAGDVTREHTRLPVGRLRQRRRVVVSVEPGGGSVDAHAVEVDLALSRSNSGTSEEQGASSVNAGRIKMSGDNDSTRDELAVGNRLSYSAAGEVIRSLIGEDEVTDDRPESFFFSLDPACLLDEVDSAMASSGHDEGDNAARGGGARLLLSTDGVCVDEDLSDFESSGNSGSDSADTPGGGDTLRTTSSAELLLFPGADPARRWVALTDRAGQATGEVDVSVGWALAAPSAPASEDGDDEILSNEEGRADDTTASSVAVTARRPRDRGSEGIKLASDENSSGLKAASVAAVAAAMPEVLDIVWSCSFVCTSLLI